MSAQKMLLNFALGGTVGWALSVAIAAAMGLANAGSFWSGLVTLGMWFSYGIIVLFGGSK